MSGYFSDYFAYRQSDELMKSDPSFYALIMAAMRKADSYNIVRLRSVFPDVWDDLEARYHAPGGVLDTDSEALREKVLGSSISQ